MFICSDLLRSRCGNSFLQIYFLDCNLPIIINKQMSLENQMDEQMPSEDSLFKKEKASKTHKIKKNPKNSEPKPRDKLLNIQKNNILANNLKITSKFGILESQTQKQFRLDNFWKEEIELYYKKHITIKDEQILKEIINEKIPNLKDVMKNNLPFHQSKATFDELYRYFQLINECRNNEDCFVLLQTEEGHFLGIFDEQYNFEKLIEISLEEAYLISQRNKFMKILKSRQNNYLTSHGHSEPLSQLSSEITFILFLMHENKKKLNIQVGQILQNIKNEPTQNQQLEAQDKYKACLIKKCLKYALKNQEIDYYNYFRNLDISEMYGYEIGSETKPINDKRQFEEYVKKKKSRKIRKNKAILRSACGACLSPYSQTYNPFLYCSECQIRFHKYCYTPIDGLCEHCHLRRSSLSKTRYIECQLCPNKGFLSLSAKQSKQHESVNVHIFCMLINGLWNFKQKLEFQTSSLNVSNTAEVCSLCNSSVYVTKCDGCTNNAHPLCAYLNGWDLQLDENEKLKINCCSDFDKEKNAKRRKFILNYKKCVFKSQNQK